jgi:hypothetical protein
MRIYSRLADAYFLQTLGGPHVIFGWGVACPDEVIGAYLGSGTLPDARVVTCEGDVADAFLPLPEEDAGDYRDALAVTQSLDDQIFSTNDYGYRLEDEPLTMGCDAGGTLTYTPTDVGTDVSLAGCAFTPGLAFTGTGSADDEAGTFELDVDRGGDSLHYERDAEGGVAVTGRYGGSPVDLER